MSGSGSALVELRVRAAPTSRSSPVSTDRPVTIVPLQARGPADHQPRESGPVTPDAAAPDATGTFARVPMPRTPTAAVPAPRAPMAPTPRPTPRPDPRGPVAGDPLTAILASLVPAPTRRPGPAQRGRVVVLVITALAVIGAVLMVIALAGQVSAPAAVDTGVLAPAGALPDGAVAAGAVAAGAVADGAVAAVPPPPGAIPTRVVVPSIDVDSRLGQVGLAPDRSMAVPPPGPEYDLAAWYRYSVAPGEQGPAVIVGHVDSRTGGPSVFFDLGDLSPGDRVSVGRADGSVADFDVYAIRTVAKDAFPTAEVYGATPGAELRLITCGGSFDTVGRSYRDNVIVFARAVRFRWN